MVGWQRAAFAVLLLAAPMLAGCLGGDDAPAASDAVQPAAPSRLGPAVVIADVSAGVNPYHETFRRPDWTEFPGTRIPGFPENATRLDLTFDAADLDAAFAADASVWANYTTGHVYWVAQTNLLLYTDTEPSWSLGPWAAVHGTGTADAVNQGCPDCYILVLQDGHAVDGSAIKTLIEDMPWVDLAVSTSPYGNAYVPPTGQPAYRNAMKDYYDAGRLYFTFSGNGPTALIPNNPLAALGGNLPLPLTDWTMPPWAVAVGGAYEDCRGSEVNAGKPTELVGDYGQMLADGTSLDALRPLQGTSFSTPQVAGRFGAALLDVRRAYPGQNSADGLHVLDNVTTPPAAGPLADGILTNTELRAAFHAHAEWFSPDEYTGDCEFGFTPGPASATPWADMGWGYASNATTADVVDHAVAGTPLPDRGAAASAYMGAVHCARYLAVGWVDTGCAERTS